MTAAEERLELLKQGKDEGQKKIGGGKGHHTIQLPIQFLPTI